MNLEFLSYVEVFYRYHLLQHSSQLMIFLFLIAIVYVYIRLSIRLKNNVRRATIELNNFQKILIKMTNQEVIPTREIALQAQKSFRSNKGKPEFIKEIEEINILAIWRHFDDNLSYDVLGSGIYLPPAFSDTFFSFERLKDRVIPVSVLMGAGVLTGIGVVGTFLGLSIGVGGASSGLASPDIQVARSAMSDLLSGAQLAFVTSLMGLFFSLVLRINISKKSDDLREQLYLLEKYVAGFITTKDANVSSLNYLSQISRNTKSEILSRPKNGTGSSDLESEVRNLLVVLSQYVEEKKNAGR